MSFQNLAVKERIRLGKKFSRELRRKLGPVLHEAFIFGSTAKGTADKDSDIDLLFVVKELTRSQLIKQLRNEECTDQHLYRLHAFQNASSLSRMKKQYQRKHGIGFHCNVIPSDEFKTTRGTVIDCLK